GRNEAYSAWHVVEDLPWRAVGRIGAILSPLLGPRTDRPLGMLTYHRITSTVPGLPLPEHNVTPERFREQLEGLLLRGFNFWPLRKVIEHCELRQQIPPRTVVITFDDGYENFYTNALPVLQDLGLPATVFVATAFLDAADPFPFDEWGMQYADRAPPATFRPLRSEQCLEMHAAGLVEIAAHTHSHQDFHGRPGDFLNDMRSCIGTLNEMLGVRELTFSFPFGRLEAGDAGEEMVEVAKSTGVKCGLTTESECIDPASDPFTWGRFTAFPFDTAATLAAKLDGWYSWAPRFLRRFSSRK
ncbi:MAG: polysaccharide deacetylase family protein, partial [Woeseia sp.]|nr:polysaccharide deacetylase family protein [Woeseia sp.]